jgi:alpha-L-rhamnosidase
MAEAFAEGRPPALAPNGDRTLLLDYGMLWVQSLYDNQRMTEDVQFLTQTYSVLGEFMAYLESYENSSTGLLDVPSGEWWETALIDWRVGDGRYGQSTALNALYYGTLIDASNIAEATGKAADAQAWRQKAGYVKKQINTYLYLTAQRRYMASFFDGEPLPPSTHAQAWPLAYRVVPEGELDGVASALLEIPINVQIYGMFWVLEALGHSGHIPEALDIIETYYGPLLESGVTTWWEGFDSHSRYAESLSHGWGGTPTWFLTTYVLGVRRTGPDTWLVKPAFSGVRYASGSLPLQDGEIQVRWERVDCEESKLELTAPPTTLGEAVIAATNETMVLTLDDHVIWQEGAPLVDYVIESSEGVHVALQGGTHTLNVLQDCHTTFLPVAFE